MATIVIAEPAACIRDLIGCILSLSGDTPLSHATPGLGDRCPDTLIVDPSWPPGLRYAQRLRAVDPGLPIICVSARAPDERSRILAPSAYLRMPFRVRELQAAVDAALGRSSG